MTTIEQGSLVFSGTPKNLPHSARHPLAMPATISVEMWERFSFYGMQAILTYYLYHSTTDGGLGLDRTQATTLLGAYGAFVYLCTCAGGWIADRVLGTEKTLLTGCIALMIGHISLSALPGSVGAVIGLGFIAVGSGFLKTAAITILGHAYPTDDPRRDSGFQLFYLGINVGAILGPLLTGWISTHHGFHAGFFTACVLMAVGLGCYLALRRRYLTEFSPEVAQMLIAPTNPVAPGRALAYAALVVSGMAGVLLLIRTGLVALSDLATVLLLVTLCAVVVLFTAMFRSRSVGRKERARLLAYLPIFVASCAFWSILNQTYGVLAVYSDIRLDRTVGAFTIPAAWTQSLNPFYILVLSIPMAWLWTKCGKHNHNPTASIKMGCGVALTGAGMLVLLPFAGGGQAATPFVALALCILVVSCGELLVGPVGMSATTAHAPIAYRCRFSALYFMTMAIGTATAGVLSRFYNPESGSAEFHYFLGCGVAAIAIGVGTVVLGAWMGRWLVV